MLQDDLTKLLNGELDEAQTSTITSKLSEEGKRALNEAIALRKERKSVEESVKAEKDTLEKVRKELTEESTKLKTAKGEISQFRQEQIKKAKDKFFAAKGVKPEQESEYDAMFAKLDSGKVDADLIYKDFVRVHAAINADLFDENQKTAEELRRQAEAANAAAAGRQGGGLPHKEPKKFSDEAEALAKAANISPEAAEKQIKEGMKRTRGF